MVTFRPEACPPGAPSRRDLPLGERPIHEYLTERARTHGDKPAVNYHGHELTYAALNDAVDRFATYLSDRGHGQGDTIVLFMQNAPQYYVGLFAGFKSGMRVTPIAPGTKRDYLEYVLGETGASVGLVGSDVAPLVEETVAATTLEDLVYVDYGTHLPDDPVPRVHPEIPRSMAAADADAGTRPLLRSVVSETRASPPRVDVSLDDVCYILYSSGTTGLPKGSMHTYRNGILASGTIATMFGYADGMDPQLLVLPITHASGLVNLFPQPIYGTTGVLLSRYEPGAVLDAIDAYDVEMFISTQSVIEELLEHRRGRAVDLSSVDYVSALGFSRSITADLVEEWRAATEGGGITPFPYASVETHGPQTMPYGFEPEAKRLGPPAYDVEIRICDPDTGEVLPDGELGEILLKSPTIMQGYQNDAEQTADAFDGDFYRTGDLGEIGENGHLYLRGRLKHMIKSSGFSVSPQEVRNALERHPDINKAAVLGRDTDDGTEIVAAVVRADEALSSDDVIEWGAETLAGYKRPRRVEFVDELPRTDVGKVDRETLDARLGE